MQPQWRRRFGFLTLMVSVFLAAPSLAARRGGAVDGGSDIEIARAHIATNVVSFEPLADYEVMTLRVSGDHRVVFEGEFAAGQAIVFDLFDQNGNALPDGTYKYELTASPRLSPDIRISMEEARANGTDEEAVRRLREAGILPERGSMTLSGSFAIANGSAVDPDLPERDAAAGVGYLAGSVAPQDQVINDDLIVTSSLCVGFDCVNGESFGFDTIRLKENNLRIHFDDTSTVSGFPNQDFGIEINSSASGGAEYFGVVDRTASRRIFTLEANAPSNCIYCDDGGRVGFGTSTPSVELHVVDGDSPTLRLAQDGSSGFSPQTWDIAGNETNFFVRDVTNGSLLPFRIRPGAGTSSIDIMSNGSVHLDSLSSTGNEDVLFLINNNDSGGSGFVLQRGANISGSPSNDWRINAHNSGEFRVSLIGSGAQEFRLDASGNLTVSGTVTPMSSRTAKENFASVDVQDVLDRVAKLELST